MRLDGQPIPQGSPLARQIEVDHTICKGEAAKVPYAPAMAQREALAETALVGCMAQRGYSWVPRSELEARRAASKPDR